MKRLSTFLLIWIVSWKVAGTNEDGVRLARHRSAKFRNKATAEAFMQSQAKVGGYGYKLTHK